MGTTANIHYFDLLILIGAIIGIKRADWKTLRRVGFHLDGVKFVIDRKSRQAKPIYDPPYDFIQYSKRLAMEMESRVVDLLDATKLA